MHGALGKFGTDFNSRDYFNPQLLAGLNSFTHPLNGIVVGQGHSLQATLMSHSHYLPRAVRAIRGGRMGM